MRNAFKKLHSILSSSRNSKVEEQTNASVEDRISKFQDGWSWIPNWPDIFHGKMDAWYDYVNRAKEGPKVLVATNTGGNSAMTPMESLLAVALTLRGANVEIVLCDKALPACQNMIFTTRKDQEQFLLRGPDKCDWCSESGYRVYKDLGLPIHFLGQWIESNDRDEAHELALKHNLEDSRDVVDDGVLIGHHAITGTLRYFGRGDFNGEPLALDVFRRYMEAGIILNRALQKLYQCRRYEHTVLNQGIYVPQGVAVGVAQKFLSTVAVFELAYRKKSIIMDKWSRGFEESNETWQSLPWNDRMENQILNYLNSRRKGTLDWIQVQSAHGPDDVHQINKELGIDPAKPTIALLTNVIWDAQVFYPTNAFGSMIEWLKVTIEYFIRRQDLQLVIRVHPGELQGFVKSRQKAVDEIQQLFPVLPPNIFVIPPESPINTYAAIERCNAVLIYATTAGIELAGVGYPVIVAGEAWVRGKGFSFDVDSEEDYIAMLDRLPFKENKLSPAKLLLAQKFAYHHYFRRMIPLELLEPQDTDNVPYTIKPVGIDGLLPGQDPGLDIICDGILHDSDFVYPYEQIHETEDDMLAAKHEFFTIGNRQ